MAYAGYLVKAKLNETFDPYTDSVLVKSHQENFGVDVEVASLGKCSKCSGEAILMLQLATPYKEDIQRVLYLYYCPKHWIESGGWSLVRFKRQIVKQTSTGATTTTTSLFDQLENATDWLSDLKLEQPKEIKPKLTSGEFLIWMEKVKVAPAIRTKDLTRQDSHVLQLLKRYKNRPSYEVDPEDLSDLDLVKEHLEDDLNSKDDDDDDEGIDSDLADENDSDGDNSKLGIDANLLKLQEFIANYSDAVIRYHHGDEPLLGKVDDPGRCSQCNTRLMFEFELLPKALKYIELKDDANNKNQVATICCYTCPKDCTDATSTKETVFVKYSA